MIASTLQPNSARPNGNTCIKKRFQKSPARSASDGFSGSSLALRASFETGVGFLAAVLAILATGCGNKPRPQGAKASEVVVTTPVIDDVMDYQDFTGRLDALKTVDVRARVTGYVQDAPFKEGDIVQEGDLLFQIDPRSYRADLNQAEANLRQAIADRKLQQKNADRAQQLINSGNGNISKEEYDQIMASWEKAKATVGSMEAARDRAKLYLDYTRVTAPLSGRISRRNVDPGNLINADNTILTTIVTINPVYAYFDVDERTYLDLVASAERGQGSWFSTLQFPVLMRLANEEEFSWSGTVNFLDNRLNANTGTIRMRGVFQNPREFLKSGLFVRIRLPIGMPYQALLISDEALLSDQGRKYVYVVNDKNEVEYRSVKLGQTIQGLRVIKEGLSASDHVIISGMQRVRPKAEVQAKMQDPPKKPDSPLRKLLTFNRPRGLSKQTAVVK